MQQQQILFKVTMEQQTWSGYNSLTILSLIFLLLNILCVCTYCFPILIIPHLRTSNNLITVNVCFASVLCTIYWTLFFSFEMFLTNLFLKQSHLLMVYIQTTVNCQAAFSLCVLSIYRFCTIVYENKRWFNKRRSMILCVVCQWIIGFLLPIPIWFIRAKIISQYYFPLWIWIYNLCLIVVLPTVFVAIIDGLIFSHAHRSSRRVQTNTNIRHCSRMKTRNNHLLKRMFFMLIVSISGWTPIYIIACLESLEISISSTIYHILRLLPIITVAIVTSNLFLYNHTLCRYLKHKFCRTRLL